MPRHAFPACLAHPPLRAPQVEEHLVDGQLKTLLVHRKGSTRAFPPHHPLIPVDYQLTGQPVLIGGTMGTCSYVLTGGVGQGGAAWGRRVWLWGAPRPPCQLPRHLPGIGKCAA